jgi:hypothetical protein
MRAVVVGAHLADLDCLCLHRSRGEQIPRNRIARSATTVRVVGRGTPLKPVTAPDELRWSKDQRAGRRREGATKALGGPRSRNPKRLKSEEPAMAAVRTDPRPASPERGRHKAPSQSFPQGGWSCVSTRSQRASDMNDSVGEIQIIRLEPKPLGWPKPRPREKQQVGMKPAFGSAGKSGRGRRTTQPAGFFCWATRKTSKSQTPSRQSATAA